MRVVVGCRLLKSNEIAFCFAMMVAALIGACRSTPTPPTESTPLADGSAATAVTDQSGGAGSQDPTPDTGSGTVGAPADANTAVAAATLGASGTDQVPAGAPNAPAGATATTLSTTPVPDDGKRYAVVGVAPDDTLSVRSAAGAGSALLGTLPPYATGLRITNTGTAPDGGAWARLTGGSVEGWVNRGFLTIQSGSAQAGIAERANEIVQALMGEDYATLSTFTHPVAGVTFSPYAFAQNDAVVLDGTEVAALGSDSTARLWGEYQAVGGPIQVTYAQYAADFVADAAFESAPYIGFDVIVGSGTTINNIGTAFPGASFVEYHYDGFDPQFAGFDWVSLRLVLQQHAGEWMLVGIVHDEWTT